MENILTKFRSVIQNRLNLNDDKADEQEIVESITKNIHFRGANLWTLIFAIIIASVGLNVNSAAVIIGAMLISPLMGPIMGVGLGIGINDLTLVKRGAKNLLIAAIASIATSALYFWITPLDQAQSELLARTTPSIWDVFIAFFGGLAGIVAGTRKEKSNVIPGVAIATALMPPLCTAGFGLAHGEMYYFFGALYLFFINSLFICIATYLIVRYLKFHKKEFEDEARRKRVSRIILGLVIITVLPSIYLAYRIVDKSIFESTAGKYVQEQFKFKRTQVVNRSFIWKDGKKSIELLLIGDVLQQNTIDSLRGHMADYNLKETKLVVYQGLNDQKDFDFSSIKASIINEVFSRTDSLNVSGPAANNNTLPDLRSELAALYPDLARYTLAKTPVINMDTTRRDTMIVATFKFRQPITPAETEKLSKWINSRLPADSVMVVIDK